MSFSCQRQILQTDPLIPHLWDQHENCIAKLASCGLACLVAFLSLGLRWLGGFGLTVCLGVISASIFVSFLVRFGICLVVYDPLFLLHRHWSVHNSPKSERLQSRSRCISLYISRVTLPYFTPRLPHSNHQLKFNSIVR